LVEPPKEFVEATRNYVCVKVTDMRDHDINNMRFDFGLTFFMILAHPGGRIYHRYGGRDGADPLTWMSISSLQRTMEKTLDEHTDYIASGGKGRPDKVLPKKTIFDIPTFAKEWKRKKNKPQCIQCHMVHSAIRDQLAAEKKLRKDMIFMYPSPSKIGMQMNPIEQDLVHKVVKGSIAANSGLRKGDKILQIGKTKILTVADIQWALQQTPRRRTRLAVRFLRGDKPTAGALILEKNWQVGTPEEVAWRPWKWGLSPKPGFGGVEIDAEEKAKHGIPTQAFAFRVTYLVTWGPNAYTGKNAARAGIRKGDIVVSVAKKRDFKSVADFHAWFRLTQKPGTKIQVQVRRNRKLIPLRLPVLE
jgi:serine protease Do